MSLFIPKLNNKLLVSSFLVSSVFFVSAVRAELVLEHEFMVSGSTEYNSNIRFVDKNSKSIEIFRVIPAYTLHALDGTNTWDASIGMRLEKTSDSTVQGDREDPFASINWLRQLENGTFGLNYNYFKRSTRGVQLDDTRDIAEDSSVKRHNVTADWMMALTDRTTASLGARFTKETFEAASTLTDNETREVIGDLTYLYNQTISPFLTATISEFRIDDATRNDSFKFQDLKAGVIWNLDPRLMLRTGAGITHQSDTGDNEASAIIEAEYLDGRSELKATALRSVRGSAIGILQITNSLQSTYSYALTERSNMVFGGGATSNNTGTKFYNLTTEYNRELTNFIKTRLYLSLAKRKDRTGLDANNNIIGVSLIFNNLGTFNNVGLGGQ